MPGHSTKESRRTNLRSVSGWALNESLLTGSSICSKRDQWFSPGPQVAFRRVEESNGEEQAMSPQTRHTMRANCRFRNQLRRWMPCDDLFGASELPLTL